jgi:transcriptional regulator with XRE-family HTH domain
MPARETPQFKAGCSPEFGMLIAEIRNQHQLTQKQVAHEAGVDSSYIAALEGGRRNPPPEKTLQRLICALQASVTEQSLIEKSAAISRVSKVIRAHSQALPNAHLILRFTQRIPELEPPAINDICTLMAAFETQIISPKTREGVSVT